MRRPAEVDRSSPSFRLTRFTLRSLQVVKQGGKPLCRAA